MTVQELAALIEHGGIAVTVLYLYFILHKDFERLLQVVIDLAQEVKATRETLAQQTIKTSRDE